MVCLPTPARAAMASTLTLAYPLSRHSDSAASRMATRELSLRREASGFVVDVGTYLRVAGDDTVRLVTRAHLRLHSRRVVSSRLWRERRMVMLRGPVRELCQAANQAHEIRRASCRE